jgi:hypothetical protein
MVLTTIKVRLPARVWCAPALAACLARMAVLRVGVPAPSSQRPVGVQGQDVDEAMVEKMLRMKKEAGAVPVRQASQMGEAACLALEQIIDNAHLLKPEPISAGRRRDVVRPLLLRPPNQPRCPPPGRVGSVGRDAVLRAGGDQAAQGGERCYRRRAASGWRTVVVDIQRR